MPLYFRLSRQGRCCSGINPVNHQTVFPLCDQALLKQHLIIIFQPDFFDNRFFLQLRMYGFARFSCHHIPPFLTLLLPQISCIMRPLMRRVQRGIRMAFSGRTSMMRRSASGLLRRRWISGFFWMLSREVLSSLLSAAFPSDNTLRACRFSSA